MAGSCWVWRATASVWSRIYNCKESKPSCLIMKFLCVFQIWDCFKRPNLMVNEGAHKSTLIRLATAPQPGLQGSTGPGIACVEEGALRAHGWKGRGGAADPTEPSMGSSNSAPPWEVPTGEVDAQPWLRIFDQLGRWTNLAFRCIQSCAVLP